MATAICPDCKATITLGTLRIGEAVNCTNCSAALVVQSLDPPSVFLIESEPTQPRGGRTPVRTRKWRF